MSKFASAEQVQTIRMESASFAVIVNWLAQAWLCVILSVRYITPTDSSSPSPASCSTRLKWPVTVIALVLLVPMTRCVTSGARASQVMCAFPLPSASSSASFATSSKGTMPSVPRSSITTSPTLYFWAYVPFSPAARICSHVSKIARCQTAV